MAYKIHSKKTIKRGLKLCRILIASSLVGSLSFMGMIGMIHSSVKRNNQKSLEKNNTFSYSDSAEREEVAISSSLIDSTIVLEEDDYIDTDIDSTPIALSDSNCTEFLNYLDGIEVDYPYSDLFGIDEALKSEESYVPIEHHEFDIRNDSKEFDVDKLYEQVLQNNREYYENLGSMRSFYKTVEDDTIYSICKLIMEVIESENKVNSIDEDRLACYLTDLKIFYRSGASMASVSSDRVLSINPSMLEFGTIIAGHQNNDQNVFIHEIIHMFQSPCREVTNRYMLGTSYKDESLSINPLYYSWHIEASAEKERMKLTPEPNIIYDGPIGYLESFNLVLSLRDDYKVGTMEDLTITQDSASFYSYFHLPKEEVVKMLYTVEIIQAEPEEFKRAYENRYGEELTDEKMLEVKRTLKGSLCASLTKEFYRNLAIKVTEGDVTLEDAFYLMKIFEADSFFHIRYDDEQKLELGKAYIDTYSDIQDIFFRLIETKDMAYEDILAYYQSYSMRVIYKGVPKDENYTLTWLSNEKRNYISNCKDSVYSKNIANPRNIRDLEQVKNFN